VDRDRDDGSTAAFPVLQLAQMPTWMYLLRHNDTGYTLEAKKAMMLRLVCSGACCFQPIL
jgi:hypothetical protein